MIRAALASRLQIGQYRMRHLKHRGQIDRQHVRPHLERGLLERRRRGLSRVVDEDIHRAEGVVRKRQRARRGGRVRDVDVRDREARSGAEFGGELLERLRSTSDQRHSRAVGRERAGDRCADAATRAGHKGVTSLQCARGHQSVPLLSYPRKRVSNRGATILGCNLGKGGRRRRAARSCHSRERGNPGCHAASPNFRPANCAGVPSEGARANRTGRVVFWIPAFAGMTARLCHARVPKSRP